MQANDRTTSKRLTSVPPSGGSELEFELPAGPPELTPGLARSLLRVLQISERPAAATDGEVPGSSHTDAVAS